MWKIDRTVKKGDYLYAVVVGHPNAIRCGYVLHHRVVMENFLGRVLREYEIVHHLDENKHNNDILNLDLMHRSEHGRLHAKVGRTYVRLTCPNCGNEFKKEKRFIKPGIVSRCSRKCNGQYSRKLQLAATVH